MSDENHCPQCGKPLGDDAPGGLCPGCLLQQGLDSQSFATGTGETPVPTAAELAPLFPDLEIIEFIGRGGMGMVYKARQIRLDRPVALKILSPAIGRDPSFAERFAREAKALAMLSHQHIVAVHDFGWTKGEGIEESGEGTVNLPSPAGRWAGGEGGKNRGSQVSSSPHPNPLPKGEGIDNLPSPIGRGAGSEGGKNRGSQVSSSPHPNPLPKGEGIDFLPSPSGRGAGGEGISSGGPLYYLVMEYIDGVNLRRLLDAGKLAPEEALAVVPQICEALQYAHDHGVVHRDIKPENILIDKEGRVKIADFGLAKLMGERDSGLGTRDSGESNETLLPDSPFPNPQSRIPSPPPLTAAGQIMGTPQYMAPEQFSRPREVDHRADIYSLGVVFYQMLTGELPVGRFAPPSKKVQIDVRLDEVVLRALEREPQRRYQQASEMKTRVETIAAEPPVAFPASRNEENRNEKERSFFGIPLEERRKGVKQIISWPGMGKAFAALIACVPVPILVKLIFQGSISRTEGIVAAVILAAVVVGGAWILLKRMSGRTKQSLAVPLLLFFLIPALCLWFMLVGPRYFRVALGAFEQFWLCALAWPFAVGLSAVLAWAVNMVLSGPDGRRGNDAPDAARRWCWQAIAAAILFAVSLPWGGGAAMIAQLLRQERSWHPGSGELIVTIFILGGGALAAATTTLLAFEALRRIRRSPEYSGRGAATAVAWFWPVMLLPLGIAMLPPFQSTRAAADAKLQRLLALAETADAAKHSSILEFRILADNRTDKAIVDYFRDNPSKTEIIDDQSGIRVAWWVPVKPGMEKPIGGIPDIVRRTRKQGSREVMEVLIAPDFFNVTGKYLALAEADVTPQGQPCIKLTFDREGALLFGKLTSSRLPDLKNNLTHKLGIIIDGELWSAPAIMSVLFDQCEITGSFTQQQAEEIAAALNAGRKVARFPLEYTRKATGGETYTASAYLRIAKDGDSFSSDSGRYEVYKNTQRQLLLSHFVLSAALRNPEAAKLASVLRATESGDAVKWLAGNLQVAFLGRAEIMQVSLTGESPEETAALVNAVVDAYLTNVVNDERNRKQSRLKELDQAYAAREEKLKQSGESPDLDRLLAEFARERDKLKAELRVPPRVTLIGKAEVPVVPRRSKSRPSRVKLAEKAAVPASTQPSAPVPPEIRLTSDFQPLDLLQISAIGMPADQSIDGYYIVEPDGNVALGPLYGRVNVNGLTAERTEGKIVEQLKKTLTNPGVQVTLTRRPNKWQKVAFPTTPFTIEPLDVLKVRATGTKPRPPIDGFFLVEHAGTVALGPTYGRVSVSGLSLAEAEKAVHKHLEKVLETPSVQVTLPTSFPHDAKSSRIFVQEVALPKAPYAIEPGDLLIIDAAGTLPDQPICDVFLVEPEGTVALGPGYGRAKVRGMSLEEAEKEIEKRLREVVLASQSAVSVTLGGWVDENLTFSRGPQISGPAPSRGSPPRK